jgi:hypothetical protein
VHQPGRPGRGATVAAYSLEEMLCFATRTHGCCVCASRAVGYLPRPLEEGRGRPGALGCWRQVQGRPQRRSVNVSCAGATSGRAWHRWGGSSGSPLSVGVPRSDTCRRALRTVPVTKCSSALWLVRPGGYVCTCYAAMPPRRRRCGCGCGCGRRCGATVLWPRARVLELRAVLQRLVEARLSLGARPLGRPGPRVLAAPVPE